MLLPTYSSFFNCNRVKCHKQALPLSNTVSSCLLDLIRVDVCGPSPTPSISGFGFISNFFNDFSRFSWIYLLKRKYDGPTILLVQFEQHMEKKIL